MPFKRNCLCAAVAAVSLGAWHSQAATWTGSGLTGVFTPDPNWENFGNWNNLSVPTGPSAQADMGDPAANQNHVRFDSNLKVGTIIVRNNAPGGGYIFNSTGAVAMSITNKLSIEGGSTPTIFGANMSAASIAVQQNSKLFIGGSVSDPSHVTG